MYVHALHTVHALPDLRVAGGRLGDGVSDYFPLKCGLKIRWEYCKPNGLKLH